MRWNLNQYHLKSNSYSGKHSNTLEVLLNSNAKTLKDPSSIVNKMTAFEVHSVICPGGEFECPDDMTCCKMETGQWGCCPFSHAVCCSDGLHCCPRGHRCDLREGKCDGESSDPIDLIELLANRRPTNWDLKQPIIQIMKLTELWFKCEGKMPYPHINILTTTNSRSVFNAPKYFICSPRYSWDKMARSFLLSFI